MCIDLLAVEADAAILGDPNGECRDIPMAVDMITVLPQVHHRLLCHVLGIVVRREESLCDFQHLCSQLRRYLFKL